MCSRGGCRPPGPPRKKAFGPTKKAPKIDPKIIQKNRQNNQPKIRPKIGSKKRRLRRRPKGARALRARAPLGIFCFQFLVGFLLDFSVDFLVDFRIDFSVDLSGLLWSGRRPFCGGVRGGGSPPGKISEPQNLVGRFRIMPVLSLH